MLKRAMVQAKRFILAKRYDGMPKITDYKLEDVTLPALNNGEILLEATHLSIDAGMRAYSERIPVGATMLGAQVAKIIESKNADYPVGAHMYGVFGWRTHTVFNPKDTKGHIIKPYILPSFGSLPISLGLGHLGMTGVTAYFGFLDICKPKEGEVAVISGAAGGVGYLVGEIAKLKGCKVIGIAGSDDKCKWLVDELGFDGAINYKTEKIDESLKKHAPDGVDCYFDNVGGEISSTVINNMRTSGRISICGCVSAYNNLSKLPLVPILQPAFLSKQLKMEGFHVMQFAEKWFDGIEQLKQWTEEGKLKYYETITDGFENAPKAFIEVLQGQNVGKGVVKV